MALPVAAAIAAVVIAFLAGAVTAAVAMPTRADAAIAVVGVVIPADAATAAAAVVIPADAAIAAVAIMAVVAMAVVHTTGGAVTAAVMAGATTAAAVTIVVAVTADSGSATMSRITATAILPTDIRTIRTLMIPTTETDTTAAGTLTRIIIRTRTSGRHHYTVASVWSSAAGGVTGDAGKGRRGCCNRASSKNPSVATNKRSNSERQT